MFCLPAWVLNWQHQANNISYEDHTYSLYVSLFALPLGLSLLFFSSSNILPCWNRGSDWYFFYFLFFWDSLFFHNCHEMGVWPLKLHQARKPFIVTYQGLFKHCAALALLHFDCLLGCFCYISERFSPLSPFSLWAWTHKAAWKECTGCPEDKQNYSQEKTKCYPTALHS